MDREKFEEIFVNIVGDNPNELQKNEIIPQFINAIENNQYIALRVPTGNGKTSLVEAYGELYGNTILLTNTIATQDSIENTAIKSGYDWMSLKGQGQYQCKIDPSKTVKDICKINKDVCKNCEYFVTDKTIDSDLACDYYKRRKDIKTKRIGIFSFDKFLSDIFWIEKKPKGNILIIDECDLFVDKVGDYLAIEISRSKLHKMKVSIQFDFSSSSNHTFASVLSYLKNIQIDVSENYMKEYDSHRICLSNLMSFTHAERHGMGCDIHYDIIDLTCKQCDKRQDWINEESLKCNQCYNCMFHLGDALDHSWYDADPKDVVIEVDKLNVKLKLIDEDPENYVYFPPKDEQEIKIRPVDVKETIKTLVSGYEKVVFLSATCTKIFFDECIGLQGTKFIDIEKTVIPEDSRPIFKTSNFPLTMKNFRYQAPNLASHTYSICELHKSQRGLLFYTGKTLEILKECWPENKHDMKDRWIMPGEKDTMDEVYEKFLKIKDGILCIACYGKFARGLNFSDDACRFQIIIKHPKKNWDDPVLMKRRLKNNDIDNIIATSTLIQCIGRGIRHKDDRCSTYLLDGNSITDIIEHAPEYLYKSLHDTSNYKKTNKLLLCECCKTTLDKNKYDLHHIQYPVIWNGILLESISCNVHKKCHVEIHHSDKYLNMRPPPGQSGKYYGVRK